jgi:hypothetical protein
MCDLSPVASHANDSSAAISASNCEYVLGSGHIAINFRMVGNPEVIQFAVVRINPGKSVWQGKTIENRWLVIVSNLNG